MNSSNHKIPFIIVAIIVALALVWLLVLKDSSQDEDSQNQPEPAQVEEDQAGGDSSQPQEDGPQTDLGIEAAAVLASYNDILQIQQQYTDTCPSEATVTEVAGQFNQANDSLVVLQTNLSGSGNPQAVEEAQGYLQEINALIELSATLGPEIVERCNIEVPAEVPTQ